jgi:hypothetical protein
LTEKCYKCEDEGNNQCKLCGRYACKNHYMLFLNENMCEHCLKKDPRYRDYMKSEKKIAKIRKFQEKNPKKTQAKREKMRKKGMLPKGPR